MANTKDKWQEIANRGLQDKFDPATRAKFDEAVRRGLITTQPQEQVANNLDVPAGGAGPAFPDRPAQPERTLGETLTGLGEAALTTATGATGGALGFAAGTLEGAARNLAGDLTQEEAMQLAQERGAALTFAPRTEAGQDIVGGIGEALGSLPPVGLTGGVLPKIALPQLAKSKSPLANKIAESNSDNIKKSFKKLGNERFEPRIFVMVKEARKQGFDEGMTTVIANANPIDKRRMLQMVDKLEKGQKDSLFQAKNRPADVAGDSLLRKIDFVKANNSQAGKQLGRIADTLKGKDVDVSDPINKFIDDVQDLGVTFDDNGKPNFAGSQIEGVAPAESLINKISLRIKRNPEPDAFEAHNFKKFIDENVNFGKTAEGLGGKTERVAKGLRAGINDSISSQSAKYKEANTRFADTISALDELQSAAGKKIDFFGPNADKATGTVLRRLMSNAQSRVTLMDAIDNIETTSKKYGGSFDDDILTQMLFADELDSVFGSGARTSLKGEVKKANVESAIDVAQMTATGIAATGAKAGLRRLRGINEKNQLKSIKRLLSAK